LFIEVRKEVINVAYPAGYNPFIHNNQSQFFYFTAAFLAAVFFMGAIVTGNFN